MQELSHVDSYGLALYTTCISLRSCRDIQESSDRSFAPDVLGFAEVNTLIQKQTQ